MPGRDVTHERFVAGDPLRGLGAVAVLSVHAFSAALALGTGPVVDITMDDNLRLQFGGVGYLVMFARTSVWVFLVLSGYLIARPFVRACLRGDPAPSTRSYLRARLLRVVPVFWVAALVSLVVFGPLGTSPGRTGAVFGFAGFYLPSPFFARISQSWTLTVEMTFYLALPLVMLLVTRLARRLETRRGKVGLLAAVLASLYFASLAIWFAQPPLGGNLSRAALIFSVFPGIALAVLEHWLPSRLAGWRGGGRLGTAIVVAGLAGAVSLTTWTGEVVRWPMSSLCAGLLVGGFLVAQWAGAGCWRLVDSRPLHYLGERSYSIYLVHLLIILLLSDALGPSRHAWHRAALLVPASLALSVLGGEALHRLVERPVMRLRRTLERGGASQPDPVPVRSASLGTPTT